MGRKSRSETGRNGENEMEVRERERQKQGKRKTERQEERLMEKERGCETGRNGGRWERKTDRDEGEERDKKMNDCERQEESGE